MHTIRCTRPLSSSFNQPLYLFDVKFERNPLSISSPLLPKCSCSAYCCSYYAANFAMCNRLAAVNPSFLCKGLSQSTLIQWSLCKRSIFHGRIRQSYGNTSGLSSFTDRDRSYCYEKLSTFKERRNQRQKSFVHRRKKQFLSNVSDDVNVMLSLLTDDVGLDYNDVKNRKKINKKYTCCDGKDKKDVDSRVSKRDLKCDDVVKVPFSRVNLYSRKEYSSGECELEGNKDFEVKSDGYVGQMSSSERKNDLEKDCKSSIDEFVGKIERQQESVLEQEELLKKDTVKRNNGESVVVSRVWRKQSEKKMNEDFSQHYSKVSVNIEPCRQHNHEINRISDESGPRMKYKRFTEMSDKDKIVIESTSSSEKNLKEVSKLQDIHIRGTSSLSESITKSTEVNDQTLDSRVERHHKKDKQSQQILGISDTHFTDSKYMSVVSHRKSNIRKEKQKQCPETSSSEAMVTNTNGIIEVKETSIEDNNWSSKTKLMEEGGSRHSSQGSGPKGPSDEMWLMTDASTQDPSEPDEPSGLIENGEPVKTSSKSLWTIIGDVVRLHWKSPRSGSHTPTSGGAKGSSYLSASSEAWFSSHEPDGSNDENMKKTSTKCLDSPLAEGPSSSTSLPKIRVSSFPLPATQMRTPATKKMVTRNKLVHKDQVFEDNYEEWEEAYTLEAKKQKEDEMFMREALLEAKKAADVWEVPVGAVLVKDGKIIARGYNLVEELQDSTAHAEMVCIRKASTNLSSWRLPHTTLYVTLEPCPMCAGAILQARIDTVVWGAPNKLLGADGSWIRLFCDGEGGSDSIPTDKPPAPTHPFHPDMVVRRGVLAAECAEVMQQFFRLRRNNKPQPPTPPSSISVSQDHHQRHHSNFFSKVQHAFNIIFCL